METPTLPIMSQFGFQLRQESLPQWTMGEIVVLLLETSSIIFTVMKVVILIFCCRAIVSVELGEILLFFRLH